MPAAAHEHATHGDFNVNSGRPTGGHLWQGEVNTPPSNVHQYGHGVSNSPGFGRDYYSNGVYTHQNPTIAYDPQYGNLGKPNPSTMFPVGLEPHQIQQLGNTAWNNGAPSGGFNGNRWYGHAFLPDGKPIRIQGFVDRFGDVSSYFPSSQQ
nr:EndoU domain-containing protein [Amycolatopsis suaedae]